MLHIMYYMKLTYKIPQSRDNVRKLKRSFGRKEQTFDCVSACISSWGCPCEWSQRHNTIKPQLLADVPAA